MEELTTQPPNESAPDQQNAPSALVQDASAVAITNIPTESNGENARALSRSRSHSPNSRGRSPSRSWSRSPSYSHSRSRSRSNSRSRSYSRSRSRSRSRSTSRERYVYDRHRRRQRSYSPRSRSRSFSRDGGYHSPDRYGRGPVDYRGGGGGYGPGYSRNARYSGEPRGPPGMYRRSSYGPGYSGQRSSGGYPGYPTHAEYSGARSSAQSKPPSLIWGEKAQRECRVYVGNLAYRVRLEELREFMEQVGDVVFVEIMTLPCGRSKGCGIVEYRQAEDAAQAIRKLHDVPLLGRPAFIREDREQDTPREPAEPDTKKDRELILTNLPDGTRWHAVKDLLSSVGRVEYTDIRADSTGRGPDSAIAVMSTAAESQEAIRIFDGYHWMGRQIEVCWSSEKSILRPNDAPYDAYLRRAPSPRRSRSRSPVYYPADLERRDHYAHEYRRSRSPPRTQNYTPMETLPVPSTVVPAPAHVQEPPPSYETLHAYDTSSLRAHDYATSYSSYPSGHASSLPPPPPPPPLTSTTSAPPPADRPSYTGNGNGSHVAASYNSGQGYSTAPPPAPPTASTGVFVRNLPYETTNEDLIELFRTCGNIVRADILMPLGKPRGCGVVRFDCVESAERAIATLSGYVYGGRALDLRYDQYG